MGLLRKLDGFRRRFRRAQSFASRVPNAATSPRICRFEQMEPRRLLAASVVPIHVGAVYFEDAGGEDEAGDLIEITFSGGAPGTQLS